MKCADGGDVNSFIRRIVKSGIRTLLDIDDAHEHGKMPRLSAFTVGAGHARERERRIHSRAWPAPTERNALRSNAFAATLRLCITAKTMTGYYQEFVLLFPVLPFRF